LLIPRLA
jgi:hypothetical protein